MSEPHRLRDAPDGGGAPEELRHLFAAGRPTSRMPDAARARIMQRVATTTTAATAGAHVVAWKVIAAIAITASIGTAIVTEVRRGASAPAAQSGPAAHVVAIASRAAPVAPATPPLAPDLAPSANAAPATSSSARARAAPVNAQAAAPANTLAAELELIERARAATSPDAALALLAEHARRFPSGALAPERELLALDMLARAGRPDEARARAQRLLPHVAGTIYEHRVRAYLTADAP